MRPTKFLGVPRVWEKIMEGLRERGKAVKGLRKKVSEAAKQAGLNHHLKGTNGLAYSVLGQKVIYKKVLQALGLDRCRGFFSGAAPLSQEVVRYFLSLDMVVHEIYGMSETTGPQVCLIEFNNIKLL